MKSTQLHWKPKNAIGFTLIELLVVIAVIGVLAALITGVVGGAKRKAIESRVQAEMEYLVTAIEAYKAELGTYPPDNYNAQDRSVNPYVNPLYYELSGVVANNAERYYRLAGEQDQIPLTQVQSVFGVDGFANVATSDADIQYKLTDLKASQVKSLEDTKLNSDLKVLCVPVDWRDHDQHHASDQAAEHRLTNAHNPLGETRINTWRYVSTNPTNNPATFDLWAEVQVGEGHKIIGNWKE